MRTSRRLWIIEGPDGAGKTTLARRLAETTGAYYVHLGAFPRVKVGLARLYVDAMMPAVLGLADVVMDRSWLSERPYGAAFRAGEDRLRSAVRSLERLAWRCQTVVVRCLPPLERVVENFGRRPELLGTREELVAVYRSYEDLRTSLPMVTLDPFGTSDVHHNGASVPHSLRHQTAGNLRGRVTIVGDRFAAMSDRDPLYQWPFGALCSDGCSRWLGDQLDAGGISERDLFWCNSDMLTEDILRHRAPIVALGDEAQRRLIDLGVMTAFVFPHPQHHRCFHANEPYALIPLLKELTS